MIEDDSYRLSSQYRLWSYSLDQLENQRRDTNRLASEKIRAAVSRARLSSDTSNGNGEQHQQRDTTAADVETLTVDEELQIVRWGCQKILDMKNVFDHPIPSHVIVSIPFMLVTKTPKRRGQPLYFIFSLFFFLRSSCRSRTNSKFLLWYSRQQFNTFVVST